MDFQEFKEAIYKKKGINLSGYKEKQLKRRIESLMNTYGLKDFREFLQALLKDKAKWETFLDKVTINVSEFFRNPEIFEKLERDVLPKLVEGKRRFKIWSAACSNGAEPYSLAIIMEERFPAVQYKITATDIDENILNAAKQGVYEERLIKNVSPQRLKKYFKLEPSGLYSIAPELKKHITFKRHDLLVDRYDTDFDLIVCRNVNIYFTRETQDKIYRNMNRSLKVGGVLFVGATENIMNYRELGFDKLYHWFYIKKDHLS
ncbi:MAG: protein-glutamate O-methyltransferase CheR [Clostridia bacterium]|nr:protein-glutamate O-methyltransferase CheR [Clostridia bacterium]